MTVDEWLRAASAQLGDAAARYEAELFAAAALGLDRTGLFLRLRDPFPESAQQQAGQLLARRIDGEPVAYLLGWRGFWSMTLQVDSSVLIPRPETELLVEIALARLPEHEVCDVLDLGTGSGAIALAIARERPRARVIALDASEAALAVARRNRDALALNNVCLARGDWFAPWPGAEERALAPGQTFDLIVSNPPYLDAQDPHLQQGDLRYEPRQALTPGADALAAYRLISAAAGAWLRPGASLCFEHGQSQGGAVREILRQAGFVDVFTRRDLEQRERVSGGLWRAHAA